MIIDIDGAFSGVHKQTDAIVMDFAKSFDRVPHKRLLYKLDF